MNAKEKLELERLERLLEAERERDEKALAGYREDLHELIDVNLKLLEAIEKVMRGDDES